MEINLTVANSFSGFLYKKSPSFFAGYQKRYFKVIDGKLLTYAEKEGGQIKGGIKLEFISEITTIDNKT
jgi:hypothetical protein